VLVGALVVPCSRREHLDRALRRSGLDETNKAWASTFTVHTAKPNRAFFENLVWPDVLRALDYEGKSPPNLLHVLRPGIVTCNGNIHHCISTPLRLRNVLLFNITTAILELGPGMAS
jgi:hypothetical protein